MAIIRWAMIGCGDVTETKSGPAFYKAKNAALHGLYNRTLSKACDYAGRHGVNKVYTTVDALFSDSEIDAVYIATPPVSHKEYALRCAEARKPCYIEKPVALNYQECLDMIKAFEATGTKAFVAYYRRRLPRFVKVKELLNRDAIGRIRYVRAVYSRPPAADEGWRVQPSVSGGGVFMDMAVHALDALDFFIGKITAVKSLTANQAGLYEPEDIVNISFTFENGVMGNGLWCFTAGVYRDEIEIVGEKGAITLACFGTGAVRLENEKGVTDFPEETPVHIQQPLIQSIVDELNGEGFCPSTLVTAARTAWVCDEVYR